MYKCHECGIDIYRIPSQVKNRTKLFCSQKCYAKEKSNRWKKGNNPRYNGGELNLICKICSKTFSSKRHGEKRNTKLVCCSKKCGNIHAGITRTGENHWAWNGGGGKITKPIRSKRKYKDWIKLVINNSGNKCQKCGSKKELHAHHIKLLSLLVEEYKQKHGKLNADDDFFYDINNGIALCKLCHRKEHERK